MKKILLASIITIGALTACNNSDNESEVELKDPTETQPVSDAIPDSMTLVNDSVLVPDVQTNPNGRGDSLDRK